jgi:RNA-directed DNA polymerase
MIKKQKKLKIKVKLPQSNIIFNRLIAQHYHDIRYYTSMGADIKSLPFRDQEKTRFATSHKQRVINFINSYKKLLKIKSEGIFDKLSNIYKKNKDAAMKGLPPPINSNLLYLVSSIPMLVTAYKKIRKNKGATTLGYILSDKKYNRLTTKQKTFVNKTFHLPDGMSKQIFRLTSKLIRSGKYPWGASRRIWLPKPGKPDAKRPITIPPFMDRVIQSSIQMVLEAIYEPWFDKLNVSFGFRPGRGVHDAIFSLCNRSTRGLHHAIEGDIKSAYDKVNRQKLLSILGKRIKDRKFLALLAQRLDYQFWDSSKGEYIEEKEGIPQGGIDSPYLWNIYMMEFDEYVVNETNTLFDRLNKKVRGNATPKRPIPPAQRRSLQRQRSTLKWATKILNKSPNDHEDVKTIFDKRKDIKSHKGTEIPKPGELQGFKSLMKENDWNLVYKKKTDLRSFKHKLIKQSRSFTHTILKLPPTIPTQKYLRCRYARYADDWILITNAPMLIVQKLKSLYKDFLLKELSATLSEEKTLITDFRQQPAHFLGYEIHTYSHNRIIKPRTNIKKIGLNITTNTGKVVFALPDKQRLISRLHMKHYCDKKGFPREIPWLSCLEPYVIIERFNSVLRGITNFYTGFIKSPLRNLARWLYIIRYSCLKTLAQKYKTTIGGIFAKFKHTHPRNSPDKARTISCSVYHVINEETYKKTWTLLTPQAVIRLANKIERIKEITSTFWSTEKKSPKNFAFKAKPGKFPTVTSDDYLEKINWVNLRTQASLDAPCCICGSETLVQMHHLRHIRKTTYELIPENRIWEKVMYLRNRKQIPVCKECHIHIIHKGKYGGTKLSTFAPTIMYDNNLITLESHIHKGPQRNYTKTLAEKGWVLQ